MITDRNKFTFVTICCWISFLLAISATLADALALQQLSKDDETSGNGLQDATVHPFSPRVDYNNEWRPVGRGDPLKNDPTFDYSPPALEHVRYWADSKDEKSGKKKDAANGGKSEVMLLGASSERVRGNVPVSAGGATKNAKGETPLLQPKYTSIRRSYYGHQLPTHLMPPPMQTISPPQMMKPATAGDYRHGGMPNYMTSSTMGMSTHVKPYYSTAATSPWMHHTSYTSSPSMMMSQHSQRMPSASAYDTHHEGSVNYVTYSRPSTISESYSPNSIRPGASVMKQGAAHRKPWLHELLQKEVIKTVKPTMPATKYLMGTTKPFYESMPSVGISTTHAPVAFVSSTTYSPRPTAYTHTPGAIFITPSTPEATTTTTRAVYTTTSTTTQPTTTTSSRLLIPTTSNLAHRPTVTPMKAATETPYAHYNHLEKSPLGPMYLIIEGHSKVKKYGKNELDTHRPKIVPVISNREPVVRRAGPNEGPSTLETFPVEHLHARTTPIGPEYKSTPSPVVSTTTTTTKPNTTPSSLKTTDTPAVKPHDFAPSVPPTGMQGLFSLLDIFQDDAPTAVASDINTKSNEQLTAATMTTILKPVPMSTTSAKPPAAPPQLDARLGTKADTIIAEDYNADAEESEVVATTEPAPREVRQIFDYDQLPETRFKDLMDGSSFEEDPDAVGDAWLDANYDDEYVDDDHQIIKRIDKLVDDVGSEEETEVEELELEEDEDELARAQDKTA